MSTHYNVTHKSNAHTQNPAKTLAMAQRQKQRQKGNKIIIRPKKTTAPGSKKTKSAATRKKVTIASPRGAKRHDATKGNGENLVKPAVKTLDQLYESFVELTLYDLVYNRDSAAGTTSIEHLPRLKDEYRAFTEAHARFGHELYNELFVLVSQTDCITPDHPILQWLTCMSICPEVHFEEGKKTRELLVSAGKTINQTPVACIWCGDTKVGPTTKMYRIKINASTRKTGDASVASNAVFMCKDEGNLVAMAYNMLRFIDLVQSDLVQKIVTMNQFDIENPPRNWNDALKVLLLHRGNRSTSDPNAFAIPISKWPRVRKKETRGTPILYVITEWRDMLSMGQNLLKTLKKRNKVRNDIEIDYSMMKLK